MKNLVIALLTVGTIASSALAREHAGHRDGGPFDGGARPTSSGDYRDGVLAGILLSTSALFASHVTADMNHAVYLNADNDAAEYLMNDGKSAPTPALAQAMQHERKFLAKAEVANADMLSDTDVAYLVMKRAESLK